MESLVRIDDNEITTLSRFGLRYQSPKKAKNEMTDELNRTIQDLIELKTELFDRESEVLQDISNRKGKDHFSNLMRLRKHQQTIRDAIYLLKSYQVK